MTLHVPGLPIALAPLIAEAKRRTLLRRSLLGLAIFLIAGGAVVLALALRPSPGPGAPRPLTSSVHAGKLSVSIPRGFNVYTLRGLGPGNPPFPVAGHVLTDFRLPTLPHRQGTIGQRLGQYLKNGPMPNQVLLELSIWPWPLWRGLRDRLHLPLTLRQPWYRGNPATGPLGARAGFLSLGGTSYEVVYWSGQSAPASDRGAILRALRSIRTTR